MRSTHVLSVTLARLVSWSAFALLAGGCVSGTPATGTPPDAATERDALVRRGDYLVNAVAACGKCHTPKHPDGTEIRSRRLAGGGVSVVAPAFEVTASNITQDPQTGIGRWTDDEIAAAITLGTRPPRGPLANQPLAVVMYSHYYKAMTPRDLRAVVAYLRTVAPVPNEIAPPKYKAPVRRPPYPDAERTWTDAELADPVMRGRYLATLAHCMECHSGRKGPDADHVGALGHGGRVYTSEVVRGYPAPWTRSVAANITSDPQTGLGRWTDVEIRRAVRDGIGRDGRPLGPLMINSAPDRMSDADLDAIVAFLRTIPGAARADPK